ncbi:hypothetical protein B0H17DRAFT_1241401 [Mycena rosella]|uniref:Uncharacterized protein n=1 Tax=Mycena rosella TaxID=1033263 RepID=A0AAD7GB32_MYCRO|nr:hypothetical protein B0H17DRAFT_1241401 [Mycena rosella]
MWWWRQSAATNTKWFEPADTSVWIERIEVGDVELKRGDAEGGNGGRKRHRHNDEPGEISTHHELCASRISYHLRKREVYNMRVHPPWPQSSLLCARLRGLASTYWSRLISEERVLKYGPGAQAAVAVGVKRGSGSDRGGGMYERTTPGNIPPVRLSKRRRSAMSRRVEGYASSEWRVSPEASLDGVWWAAVSNVYGKGNAKLNRSPSDMNCVERINLALCRVDLMRISEGKNQWGHLGTAQTESGHNFCAIPSQKSGQNFENDQIPDPTYKGIITGSGAIAVNHLTLTSSFWGINLTTGESLNNSAYFLIICPRNPASIAMLLPLYYLAALAAVAAVLFSVSRSKKRGAAQLPPGPPGTAFRPRVAQRCGSDLAES